MPPRRAPLTDRSVLIAAAIAGALLWALSPVFTGRSEPWDASGGYYWIGLLVIGAVLGALAARPSAMRSLALGLWLGQALYGLVALGFGSLFPLGLIVLALFLLPSLLAARIAIWMAGRGVIAERRDD
jgi:hypothetical protein